MPEFILNRNESRKLDDFTAAYIEAMFFTNGDCGDDREDLLNELGTNRLTLASLAAIKRDCAAFQDQAANLIKGVLRYGQRDLDGIAHDFWFSRQGHGVGFWEGKSRGYPGETGRHLNRIAEGFGESYVSTYRGWIYVQ